MVIAQRIDFTAEDFFSVGSIGSTSPDDKRR